MSSLSINELHENYANSLDLRWVAGQVGGNRTISLKTEQRVGKVSYLNLIHPHQIQVIGPCEWNYLDELSKPDHQDTLDKLFKNENLSCIIMVESNGTISAEWLYHADHYRIPLFVTPQLGEDVISYLNSSLTRVLSPRITLHGVLMDVLGMGVLIMGDSGTGKSELALELVSRGHRLIADDAPEFFKIDPNIIVGTCAIQDMAPFLEVRGLGILNVQALFGNSVVKQEKYLRLIVQLEHLTPERSLTIDRLQGDYRIRHILGVGIHEIALPVAPGRNLAVLLECAVRNYSLRTLQNYNAADEFCCKLQQQLMPTE